MRSRECTRIATCRPRRSALHSQVSALSDIRLAIRVIRRTPLSSAVALVSIALSVGATAVVFAAVKSVLIDALPYTHSEELVEFRSEFPKMQQQPHGNWIV